MLNGILIIALQMAAALLLDKAFGEFSRWHPLVGFGKLANWLEGYFNKAQTKGVSRLIGCVCWLVLILPLPLLLVLLHTESPVFLLLEVFVLYLAIGQNSLSQHALQILRPLQKQNIDEARHFTGYMVSRDTQNLSEHDMTRATVESVLENGHDAVLASLFYFVIGGAPLVILHRLANTLDAMWGYKNQRFLHFGWCAAKSDDLLGFFSACCSALYYALQARPVKQLPVILGTAWQQSKHYKSKNGGLCMSSGAQVLGFSLGGTASYHGKKVVGSLLGKGREVQMLDILASIQLVKHASWLLVISVTIIGLLCQET